MIQTVQGLGQRLLDQLRQTTMPSWLKLRLPKLPKILDLLTLPIEAAIRLIVLLTIDLLRVLTWHLQTAWQFIVAHAKGEAFRQVQGPKIGVYLRGRKWNQ